MKQAAVHPPLPPAELPSAPVSGRTYSLYGGQRDSNAYFGAVAHLIDLCLVRFPGGMELLRRLTRESRSGRSASAARRRPGSVSAFIAAEAEHRLGGFFFSEAAPGPSRFDLCRPFLRTTRSQQILFALEAALQNRLSHEAFTRADHRIALMPHCLRDHSRECMGRKGDLDQECAGCSKACWINHVTRVLRHHRVEALLWRSADLKKILATRRAQFGEVAVLGIACLPQLVMGMRDCRKAGVAVVGVPLDANRCVRWLGNFQQTTINLGELGRRVAAAT